MRQRGLGMIEVLVTMIIVAVGLLGLAGLQTRAQRVELESYQRVQALVLLDDIAARLRANREAARCYETDYGDGDFVGHGQDPEPCQGWADLESRAMADSDMTEWDNLLDGSAEIREGNEVGAMSGARGCVTYDTADEVYTVSVAWHGEVSTTAPANPCGTVGVDGEDHYGDDDSRRRVVDRTVRLPNLSGGGGGGGGGGGQ